MRYKRITIIGFSVILTVVVLSILVYYFNQDECPLGTFLCQNSTICMPQRSWCNGHVDCPNGDDENLSNCFDANGNWAWFLKQRPKYTNPICNPEQCPHEEAILQKGCKCKDCLVTCEGYSEIPQTMSSNITTMTLTNNSLTFLSAEDFERYTEVRTLYLKFNNIKELQPGAFIGQSQLSWLVLSNNELEIIKPGYFIGLSSLEVLLADNNKIVKADFSDLENSNTLEWIDLSKNAITHDTLILPYLPALRELILDDNSIQRISSNFLSRLPLLSSLSLEGNHLRYIDPTAFNNLVRLTELNLAGNELITIPKNTFNSLGNLTKLMIGYNPIENLPMAVLTPLKNIQSLGVEEINMVNIEKNAFDQFKKLDFVYFKKFYYCTIYAPNVKKCRPITDGVSSLSHLLERPLLRGAVWGISSVTCVGNSLVLWGRFTAKDENRVLSILIRNLAVSDMLMGVYLMIIGFEDIYFRDTYKQNAIIWTSSWSCTLVGMLAMISSEVSVLILSFMSIERFIIITSPFKGHYLALNPNKAARSMIVIWIVGIIIAMIPAVHWRSSTRFYGLNGMCFPLHIDDPFSIGWEYSAFIFLGINMIGLIIVSYVYVDMFATIWQARNDTPLSIIDSEFALRFFLIVLTDAACWAPIICLKIMAFLNFPVPPDLHGWVVVFILPVNSAINPLLYTFTTPRFRERLGDGWFGKVWNHVSMRKTTTDNCYLPSVQSPDDNENVVIPLTTIAK